MKHLAIALLLIPGSVFAAAGFADAYYNHRNWIFPAYYYCLFFGLLLLFGMFIISLNMRQKHRKSREQFRTILFDIEYLQSL